MSHSLRAKLSGLRYKGILEDKDYKRLCKALDNENVLEQIRDEIEQQAWAIAISDTDRANGMWDAYRIIDKYKGDKE